MEESMMVSIEMTVTELIPEISKTFKIEAIPRGYKMMDVILQVNCNSKDFSEAIPFWIKTIYS